MTNKKCSYTFAINPTFVTYTLLDHGFKYEEVYTHMTSL